MQVPIGSERPMKLPDSRLSGRPDRIEQDSYGVFHVTDLKTHRSKTKKGSPSATTRSRSGCMDSWSIGSTRTRVCACGSKGQSASKFRGTTPSEPRSRNRWRRRWPNFPTIFFGPRIPSQGRDRTAIGVGFVTGALVTSETLPHHGAFTHPRNFYGERPSRAWSDALRLRVFIEPGHSV